MVRVGRSQNLGIFLAVAFFFCGPQRYARFLGGVQTRFWRFPNVFGGTQAPFRASKIDVFSWLGPSCAAFHNGMLDFGGLSKIVVGRFPNVFGGTLWSASK